MKRSVFKTAFVAVLFSLSFIVPIDAVNSSNIVITDAQAWFESAYIIWQPVESASSYNVYYSGEGISGKKIDNQLIRSYGSYFRADILGLKAGSYTFTVKAVSETKEEFAELTTEALEIVAHDRSGYAFWDKRVPGAYKADGSLKDNAVVIYITENNKDQVSAGVVMGNKGETTCVGFQGILDGLKKGKDSRPFVFRLVGQITDFASMDKGDIVIENKNNANSYITLEGVGDDAVADGWGIRLKNASNVEIRNIGIMNCDSNEGDNIGLQQNNDYVWIHHCDFFYGHAGNDSDQAKGDGALDCKKSDHVTFSYNHFWDTGKSNLLGLKGENDKMYITYHHNWYDHSDSRHPRVRFYSAHVYNNYYDGIAKYGVGSTLGSSVFVEGNYFRNCKYPILTSMQGSDVWDEKKQANDYGNKPTFSKENGGSIKAFNNYMEGQTRFVAYGAEGYLLPTTVDFDAYVVASRDEQVPAGVVSVYGKNTYNNFDTDPSAIYAYTADSPEDAKTKVMAYAGRVKGGDFKWSFDNTVDDASYDVNMALKSALMNYKTSLVAVQGESEEGSSSSVKLELTSGSNRQSVLSGDAITTIVYTAGGTATSITVEGLPDGLTAIVEGLVLTISGTPTQLGEFDYIVIASDENDENMALSGSIVVQEEGEIEEGELNHNFTTQALNSLFYTFGEKCNLSTSKGSVVYEGATLTRCLKMESATLIQFTAAREATLTLVFKKEEANKKVKINDKTLITDSNGILEVEIPAGICEIKKGDAINLFYMGLVYGGNSSLKPGEMAATSFSFYPNPVVHSVTIDSDAIIKSIELYSITGQRLTATSGNVRTLNMSAYAAGTYYIKVLTEKEIQGQWLIKK